MASPTPETRTQVSASLVSTPQQTSGVKSARWIRLSHWLVPVLIGFWSVVIIGIVINLGSTWLVSKSMDVMGTPLGWMLDHWLLVGIFVVLLLVLTLVSAGVRARYPLDAPVAVGKQSAPEIHIHLPASMLPAPVVEALPDRLASASPLPLYDLPFEPNPYFTGREQEFARLEQSWHAGASGALPQRSRRAISGLGGVGKTQLALEYAYRHKRDYQAIFWVHADTREALSADYLTIAELLDLPEKNAEQPRVIETVKGWLGTHDAWLLILDNLDDPAILPPFLPNGAGGHILITTRAHDLGNLAEMIKLDAFDNETAALFLLRSTLRLSPQATLEQASAADREQASELARELGGLPLALDQAAAYITRTSCGLAQYLVAYRTRHAELLKRRGAINPMHPEPVATTWDISFERVIQRNPAAADLLRFCAFLAPDEIPEELITGGAEQLGALLQEAAGDTVSFNDLLGDVLAYSLLLRDPDDRMLTIHRLVQAVIRDSLSQQEQQIWRDRVIKALAPEAVFPWPRFGTWEQCERMVPHVLECARWSESAISSSLDLSEILVRTACYFYDRGYYAEAEPLFLRAWRIRESLLGPDHVDVATILSSLAWLYRALGRYEEAEPLLQRTLRTYEQALGPDNHKVGKALNSLAELYRTQGRYDKIEPMFQRAQHIREQTYGPEDRRVGTTLYSLARLYRDQRRYDEAEPLFLRALRIREQAYGPIHPYVGQVLSNLALLYLVQGRYDEAEPLFRRALDILERTVGPNHPNVGITLDNLTRLLVAQKRYDEARPLLRRALDILERTLGPNHPNTNAARENYRALLQEPNIQTTNGPASS